MLEDIQRLADQLQKHADRIVKAIERAREDGTSAPDQAEE